MSLTHTQKYLKMFLIFNLKKINPKQQIYQLEVIRSKFCEYFTDGKAYLFGCNHSLEGLDQELPKYS